MTAKTQPQTGRPALMVREAGLYALSALAFLVSVATTICFSRSMSGGMEMPGGWTMSMMWMRMPSQSWTASATMFMLMWLAMMVAMMLPSALPMLRNFRSVLDLQGVMKLGTPLALAACGYFVVWLAVGGVVYLVGVAIADAAMRWPELSRVVPVASGATLVVAGCIQFTRWKMAGLRQCRDPLACASSQLRAEPATGWRHGLEQGGSCLICCSPLMMTVLVLGVMNLAAMASVAVMIAMEKLMPRPEPVVRCFGLVALVAGAVMIARSLL